MLTCRPGQRWTAAVGHPTTMFISYIVVYSNWYTEHTRDMMVISYRTYTIIILIVCMYCNIIIITENTKNYNVVRRCVYYINIWFGLTAIAAVSVYALVCFATNETTVTDQLYHYDYYHCGMTKVDEIYVNQEPPMSIIILFIRIYMYIVYAILNLYMFVEC